MKIPAPIIPPITAMVVPNKPSWRTSPPPWSACLLGLSVIFIESDLCFTPRNCPSRPFAIGAYSTTAASGHKIGRRKSLAFGRERYYLRLKSLHHLCDKGVVDVLPGVIRTESL